MALKRPPAVQVDNVSIPTGEIAAVRGTPFDFTTPHTVGERIAEVPGVCAMCRAVCGVRCAVRGEREGVCVWGGAG